MLLLGPETGSREPSATMSTMQSRHRAIAINACLRTQVHYDDPMGSYDTEQDVDAYVHMARGIDGRNLVAVLDRHLPAGSAVLEIGMGPGKDLRLLGRRFRVTGSDTSSIFVDRARAADANADVLSLDAVTLETDRRFDAIYSNKVLHQLAPADLARSLAAQHRVLRPNGIALHSLWHGDRLEVDWGEHCQYYTAETFAERTGELFEIVDVGVYAEMADDDSLYVVLRRLRSCDRPNP